LLKEIKKLFYGIYVEKVLQDSRRLSTEGEASHLHVGPTCMLPGPLWALSTDIF
jgi:hypothetical protein